MYTPSSSLSTYIFLTLNLIFGFDTLKNHTHMNFVVFDVIYLSSQYIIVVGESMATRRRRRGARTRGFVGRAIRRYALAIMFVLLGAFIVGVIGYMSTLIPETNLTIGSLTISNRLFINFIAWVSGILFVLTGLRRFGLPL
jgi:hypothetical protein